MEGFEADGGGGGDEAAVMPRCPRAPVVAAALLQWCGQPVSMAPHDLARAVAPHPRPRLRAWLRAIWQRQLCGLERGDERHRRGTLAAGKVES